MNEIIEIEGMEFFAFHGCYETERVVGNKFMVYARIETDCSKAAQTDNIEDALSYLTAYEIIAKEMMITSHLLDFEHEEMQGRYCEMEAGCSDTGRLSGI